MAQAHGNGEGAILQAFPGLPLKELFALLEAGLCFLGQVALILCAYGGSAELAKARFYRKVGSAPHW